ncbi:MAG TPA: hypothetical protein VFD82_23535 [Planctomycetota bacterium]|nr:hypothetical protein [Planctomycetota bacterium]
MQPTQTVGLGALLAGLCVLAFTFEPETPGALPLPQSPPVANGHYVLVVEGDRDQLTITHASAKTDPWAGVPKGFSSTWTLTVQDERGATLATVPLDVSKFAVAAAERGRPLTVEGCVVRDSRIAMLVNVPRFDAAATYTLTRQDGDRGHMLGTATGAHVRDLAESRR